MASLQKFNSLPGWRVHWRLYFPDGTNKEKYKASCSKTKLERILPDINLVEMLSQRNGLMRQDLILACNIGIISREEVSVFEATDEHIKDQDIESERRNLLKDLTDQLRSAGEKLFKAKEELEEYSKQSATALAQYMKDEWNQWKKRFVPNEYPDPPPGVIKPTAEGIGVPVASGIYFVWENGIVAYVGQSVNMNSRVRLNNHQAIYKSDLLSFVPFKKGELVWAECYYIGMMKPPRNRGTPTQKFGIVPVSPLSATVSKIC